MDLYVDRAHGLVMIEWKCLITTVQDETCAIKTTSSSKTIVSIASPLAQQLYVPQV